MDRIKTRDWNAVAAHFRKGGAMKHRNTPRGGARNESRDLIGEESTMGMPNKDDKAAAMVLKCRACLDKGKPWTGALLFANEDGVYVYCRSCNIFMARTPPLAMDMICDLCKEGVEHTHDEFAGLGKEDESLRQEPADTEDSVSTP